jgi:uncharacterized protein (DUF488 family)
VIVRTIGHSTRPAAAFLELLDRHAVAGVADVRAFPRSRRHPQYDGEALARLLAAHRVRYRHFPDLGGRRKPRAESRNTAWRDPAFRAYADYMQTADFGEALADLLGFAAAQATAVMCAEATWWTCHRRLLADALVAQGVRVLHILSTADAKPHELSEFARIDDGVLTYPGLL